MAKNDYRRSLIMLRGMEKGYSGHARLETRVLSGSLNITVSAPAGDTDLCVALIGWRGKQLTGIVLGRLRDDGRGQKGLLASFDPRSVAGIGLDAAVAVVVVRQGEPVLYGWINGSTALDWQKVRAYLLTLCPQSVTPPASATPDGTPAQDEAPPPAPDDAQASGDTQPPAADSVNDASAPGDTQPPTTGSPNDAPAPDDAQPPSADSANDAQATESAQPPAGGGTNQSASPQGSDEDGPAFIPAAQALGLDMEQPWPPEAQDLRVLFLTRPRFEPFDMPDFVFVRAAMAEETHIDYCAVGIRAENGRVTGVCYAIPMPYSPQPPAGLEEAVWVGDSNRGWWVTVRDIPEE